MYVPYYVNIRFFSFATKTVNKDKTIIIILKIWGDILPV